MLFWTEYIRTPMEQRLYDEYIKNNPEVKKVSDETKKKIEKTLRK